MSNLKDNIDPEYIDDPLSKLEKRCRAIRASSTLKISTKNNWQNQLKNLRKSKGQEKMD